MRIFKEPNLSGDWQCPICKTREKKEVVLIGIARTEVDGIMQAEEFHLSCIELLFDKEHSLIYQSLTKG